MGNVYILYTITQLTWIENFVAIKKYLICLAKTQWHSYNIE